MRSWKIKRDWDTSFYFYRIIDFVFAHFYNCIFYIHTYIVVSLPYPPPISLHCRWELALKYLHLIYIYNSAIENGWYVVCTYHSVIILMILFCVGLPRLWAYHSLLGVAYYSFYRASIFPFESLFIYSTKNDIHLMLYNYIFILFFNLVFYPLFYYITPIKRPSHGRLL